MELKRTAFRKMKDYKQLFEQMDLPVAIIWEQKDKLLVGKQQVHLLKKPTDKRRKHPPFIRCCLFYSGRKTSNAHRNNE